MKKIYIVLIIIILCCCGYCIVWFTKEQELRLKQESLDLISSYLERTAKTSSIQGIVSDLIQKELQDQYMPVDSAPEILQDFVDHDLVEPLKYIITVDNYRKYVNIFDPIRKVISELAYFDHDFFEMLEGGNTKVHYLNKDTFYYQSKKNILTKENWSILFKAYQKEKKLQDSYFIDSLWSHPTARAILQSKGIKNPIVDEQFLKIYKGSYKELEPYVIEILEKIVPDFCNFILEKEGYKQVDFDTVLFTYEMTWTAYMPDINGAGAYYNAKVNMTKVYETLTENNYPKLYY